MTAENKVPAIRFEGFSKSWLVKKLNDLTETGFSNGIFNDPQKVGKGYRLINVKDMYTGNYIDVDSLSLIDIDEKEFKNNKVEFGDIFFTRSSLVKEGIAYSNVNLSNHQRLTYDGHLIRMQPCKKLTTPLFLASVFKTSSVRNQFILGGKTTTMTTIGQSDIASVEVAIPSLKEQTKIGNYFQQLDTLIAQHQQKHDKLLNLKKALLEKMFPTQGATEPEIRFKGFSGEWASSELGKLLDITSAARVHKNEWTDAGVPFFRTSDVVSMYNGQENKKAYISFELYKDLSARSGSVKKDDLLITGGGSIGIPYLITTSDSMYFKDADLLWLKNTTGTNGYFLFTFFSSPPFRKYINSITHIGTISHYTIEQAKTTPIYLSEKSEEQTKIGNLFKQLDTLITQHQAQLKKLNNIKQACLEKMFV